MARRAGAGIENLTPRAAALDPQLRPVLLALLKERVRLTDERARETGMTLDCNWLLRELGAHELIFDPPPLRRCQKESCRPARARRQWRRGRCG